jgi:hypothetical protein
MIKRDFIFRVKGNSYNVSIPTPRQLLAIESAKAFATNGIYADINNAGTVGSNYALDIADMHAYLTVLAPSLIEDIAKKGTTLLDMDLFDMKELKEEYSKQFVPWVNSWMKMLQSTPEEINVQSEENEEDFE